MNNMDWQPIDTIPLNGVEILIKTDVGIVSAWFCHEEPTNDAKDDGCHDWICYDDMFQIDGHNNNLEAWMPKPDNAHSELSAASADNLHGHVGRDG